MCILFGYMDPKGWFGFRVLGSGVLGFRVWGFRVWGFRL